MKSTGSLWPWRGEASAATAFRATRGDRLPQALRLPASRSLNLMTSCTVRF